MQVVATTSNGDKRVSFRMRPETPFGKLMHAWCAQFRIALDRARFDLDGRELRSEDTPVSFGLQADAVPLVIRAAPRRTIAAEGTSTASATPSTELARDGAVAQEGAVLEATAAALAAPCRASVPAPASSVGVASAKTARAAELAASPATTGAPSALAPRPRSGEFAAAPPAAVLPVPVSPAPATASDGVGAVAASMVAAEPATSGPDGVPQSGAAGGSRTLGLCLQAPRSSRPRWSTAAIKLAREDEEEEGGEERVQKRDEGACFLEQRLRAESDPDLDSSSEGSDSSTMTPDNTEPSAPKTRRTKESLARKEDRAPPRQQAERTLNGIATTLATGISGNGGRGGDSGGCGGIGGGGCLDGGSGGDGGVEQQRVQYRIVARSQRGENEVIVTLPADQPLERLMAAWCEHHGLAREKARFAVVSGLALSGVDTALKLIDRGAIPRAALSAGRESGADVVVRAIPSRRKAVSN